MAKATDPFAELKTQDRRITPKILKGKKREIWDQFVKRYHNGEFAGLSMSALYAWAKQHCGLNCSLSCFRGELLNQK